MSRSLIAWIGCVLLAAAACGGSGATTTAPAPTTASPSASTSSIAPSASPSVASASPTASPSAATGQPITLSEWKVTVASTFKAGSQTFTITNAGAQPHELLMFKSDLDPAKYPTDGSGDIVEDGAGVTLVSDGENIDPAGTQVRTADLTAGKYVFVCNIPGHFKQGMFTVVTVTP